MATNPRPIDKDALIKKLKKELWKKEDENRKLKQENKMLKMRLQQSQTAEQKLQAAEQKLLHECLNEFDDAAAKAKKEADSHLAQLTAQWEGRINAEKRRADEYYTEKKVLAEVFQRWLRDEDRRVALKYQEQQLAATRGHGHWTVRVSHHRRRRDPRPGARSDYQRTSGPHDQVFHFSSVDSVYQFLLGLDRLRSESFQGRADAVISIYQPHYKLYTVAEALQECVGSYGHCTFRAPVRAGLFRQTQGPWGQGPWPGWVVRQSEVAQLLQWDVGMLQNYRDLIQRLAPRTLTAEHLRRSASVGQETAQIVYCRQTGQHLFWRE